MKQLKFTVHLKSGQNITQPVNVGDNMDVNQTALQLLAQFSTVGFTQAQNGDASDLLHHPAHQIENISVEIPRVEIVNGPMPPLQPHLIKS